MARTKQTKLMSIGNNISDARRAKHMTQQDLADELAKRLDGEPFSTQSISLWENGNTLPSTYNLILLSEILGVSLPVLIEGRKDYKFNVKDGIYDYKKMILTIKKYIDAYKLENTAAALDFAIKAHEGVNRNNSKIPYIYHPLNCTCHLIAMNLIEDGLLAASLLHDTLEDCPNIKKKDLPVNNEIKEIVVLLTHTKDFSKDNPKMVKTYYDAIETNSKAALIKCIDRCNNITTMVWGLTKEKVYRYIDDTEKYILPMLKRVVKKNVKYNNAAWLLSYQMQSTLDIYKRMF